MSDLLVTILLLHNIRQAQRNSGNIILKYCRFGSPSLASLAQEAVPSSQ